MAFELEVLLGPGILERRLQIRGDDALAVRVDVGQEVALGVRGVALAALAGVGMGEQAVVDADLGFVAVRG